MKIHLEVSPLCPTCFNLMAVKRDWLNKPMVVEVRCTTFDCQDREKRFEMKLPTVEVRPL